jgi:mannose-1-phosphate guanylyltransferase
MEHATRVAVVRGDFQWSDVGSWDEVWRLLEQDRDGNARRGTAQVVEGRNNLILAGEKLIAVVGMSNLIVVDAGDALLICPRENSQQVRELVDRLEKDGRDPYL